MYEMYPRFGIYWVHNLQEHGKENCFICLLKIPKLFAFHTSAGMLFQIRERNVQDINVFLHVFYDFFCISFFSSFFDFRHVEIRKKTPQTFR